MKKHLILIVAGLLISAGTANTSQAQVKSVHMKIAGYLCGN